MLLKVELFKAAFRQTKRRGLIANILSSKGGGIGRLGCKEVKRQVG
ncbi:hypothetical protein M1N68_02405 [Peptococcaceae bacterium]|nr:hypothetical protein [Peptococcaceae bacterium]